MSKRHYRTIAGLGVLLSLVSASSMAEDRPTLYTVATAHLDTQWNWTIKDTIERFIPDTLRKNFALFDKYPNYVFNFEGAFRYAMAKEYYPDLYNKLREYAKAGRWKVAGSSWDAVDTNVPSPESLFRNILYGEQFFERELGAKSRDIFLPDCFGFGYALPTIASSSGLLGFSTQKLSWGSAYGVPFDIGKWVGPDGSYVVGALNAGDYTGSIKGDLSSDSAWMDRMGSTLFRSGVSVGYLYHGTGDQGGSPKADSVANMEKSIKGKGPIKVVSASSDQLYKDLTKKQKDGLEEYNGELVMTTHGTGSYTSRTISKRWNRKNEVLGDAAEKVDTAADWMGGSEYPKEALSQAWKRFLWHQFHDDITGTSIPQAYQFSWNDYILSLNTFSTELETGVGSVANNMDTQTQGTPVLVYNPQSHARTDVAQAEVSLPETGSLRVYGPDGKEVPSQLSKADSGKGTISFLATLPSVGFAIYDIRKSETPCTIDSGLKVDKTSLENTRYKVVLNSDGDISEIFDKKNNRQMLAAPLRWQLLSDQSEEWPAWEITYKAISAKPKAYVTGPADIKVVESGPARVALEVTRKVGPSTFVQKIGLASGTAGDRVEVSCTVQWYSGNTLLKAAFPLRVKNNTATYNLGVGTIARGNNTSSLYEVPAQQWTDLTDSSGKYGVSILSDCKYGWDKPSDDTLRLTLIHTPSGKFNQQQVQDFGENRFSYAIYGHAGRWADGNPGEQAEDLGAPLMAFSVPKHQGRLGSSYSFASVDRPQVNIMALKKAEDSDEVIIRLQETKGKAVQGVSVRLGSGIESAREVNAQEEPLGPAVVKDGVLKVDFAPYKNKTYAVKLKAFGSKLPKGTAKQLELPYDTDVVSLDSKPGDGQITGLGVAIPGELLPSEIVSGGVTYRMGSTSDGKNNAMACRGQVLRLPEGSKRVYLLAASTAGDIEAPFTVGGEERKVVVQDILENVGQWDNYALGTFGRIKKDSVAFVATHRHAGKGNVSYEFCYLFAYPIDLPEGVSTLQLPNDPRILVMAATATNRLPGAVAARPLYDTRDSLDLKRLSVVGGTGSGSYPVGARATISATTPAGSMFVRWEGTGVDSPSSSVTTVAVSEATGVRAIFKELGTNLALGMKATANQNVSGETPEKAIDGSVDGYGSGNSKWCSTEGTIKWLRVDLGKECPISTWVVRHAGAGGEDRNWNTRDFELQISANGKNWTTVDKVTGNTQDVTAREISTVMARYVRLYITNTGGDKAARIYEFEVY